MRLRKKIVNLTEPEKAQFEEYLDKKLATLQPILDAHYPDADSVYIDASVQKHDKHRAFEFRLLMEMPRKRLMSREVKHTITESLDFASQRMETQLVKHFKRLTRA